MFSGKVTMLARQLREVHHDLDRQIREESGGRFGVCSLGRVQLFATPTPIDEVRQTAEELETYVGPMDYDFTSPERDVDFYKFRLGDIGACAGVPHAPKGGAADDV